jgi:hypothetical protein
MWTWWKTRNKINAEGGYFNLGHIESQVRRLGAKYEEFFLKESVSTAKILPKWKAPERDVLKINIDGVLLLPREMWLGAWDCC